MVRPESAPPRIAALAQQCVEGAQELLDFELDLTVETLPVLDHYCRLLRAGPGWPDSAETMAQVLGAYFGEVVRRQYGSRWHLGSESSHAWRLEFEDYFLCFNPMGVALEMLLEGDALGWNAAYLTWPEATDALQSRLSNLPQVSEEDFYSFSVRYEVLETVTDFLAGWTAKDPPKIYDSSFYQEQIAARGEPEIVFTVG